MRDKQLREALVRLGIIKIETKHIEVEHGSHYSSYIKIKLGKLLREIKGK